MSSGPRPAFEKFYPFLLLGLGAFFISDVTTTAIRDKMLPSYSPTKQNRHNQIKKKSRQEYAQITKRNPFNSDGIIPPPISQDGQDDADDSVPVPSQLPLTLVGTIVHGNPMRSVGTIQNRNAAQGRQYQAYRVDDEIPGLAQIQTIERKRVVFRNLNNGRREYIEVKEDQQLKLGLSPKKPTQKNRNVQKDGNHFVLKRSNVMKHLNNLPKVLQTARAVPNIIPGSGGTVDGFRLLEMEKGSIFEELGLKRLDVIKGANGELVNSPAEAMELFNKLKTANSIDLEIERNGVKENLKYIIE